MSDHLVLHVIPSVSCISKLMWFLLEAVPFLVFLSNRVDSTNCSIVQLQ